MVCTFVSKVHCNQFQVNNVKELDHELRIGGFVVSGSECERSGNV